MMMRFFASFNTSDLVFMPRLEDVFDLYTKMLLGMGLVFQMPTVVYFLAKMRLVTAKFLWRHTKYAVLIIFILAAVITPSGDMITQTIFAAPMLGALRPEHSDRVARRAETRGRLGKIGPSWDCTTWRDASLCSFKIHHPLA